MFPDLTHSAIILTHPLWQYGYGMAVSLSLIVAIGAQNAFVLKQGLKKQAVFMVCLLCAGSDAILILSGVYGFGGLIQRYPAVVTLASYLGAIFLIGYGLRNLYQAMTQSQVLLASGDDGQSYPRIALMTLAFTWLNPHVYLDTVVLLGTVSAKFSQPLFFALGAISSSVMFFFALGYGARLLQPIFSRPQAWQVLDIVIGVMMIVLAIGLLLH